MRLQLAGTINVAMGTKTLWAHLPRFQKGPNAVGTFIFLEALFIKLSSHLGRCFDVVTFCVRLITHISNDIHSFNSLLDAAAAAPLLLVQSDNATGESKNKFIFGILGLLVLLGWFVEFELNMLLKGHTHDMQDAVFGTFERSFRDECTLSMAYPL